MFKCVLGFYACACLCAGADFQTGKRAYDQGDYPTAIREWLPLAEKGDAEAQRSLGDMSRYGRGIPVDEPQALRWYRSAANRGNVKARFDVVDLCTSPERLHVQAPGGRIVEMDDDPLTEPCEGVDAEKEHAQIRGGITTLAEEGDAEAQFMISVIIRSHRREAGKLLDKESRLSQERDSDKWLRDSARQGYVPARVMMVATCLVAWPAEPQKEAECRDSRESLVRMVDDLTPGDQVLVAGSFLITSSPFVRDSSRGLTYLEKAARRGSLEAAKELGTLLYDGSPEVVKDYPRAAQWYRRYVESEKVAIESFHSVREALERLGYTYSGVRGVPTNDEEAVRWLQRAAAMGSAYAQRSLGYRYKDGSGVSRDWAVATSWFRRAAEQGDEDSQYMLGVALGVGMGEPQDYIHAHMWLNLAAARGNSEAAAYRDGLAEHMSPEQVGEAQALATNWSAKPDPSDITQVK